MATHNDLRMRTQCSFCVAEHAHHLTGASCPGPQPSSARVVGAGATPSLSQGAGILRSMEGGRREELLESKAALDGALAAVKKDIRAALKRLRSQ